MLHFKKGSFPFLRSFSLLNYSVCLVVLFFLSLVSVWTIFSSGILPYYDHSCHFVYSWYYVEYCSFSDIFYLYFPYNFLGAVNYQPHPLSYVVVRLLSRLVGVVLGYKFALVLVYMLFGFSVFFLSRSVGLSPLQSFYAAMVAMSPWGEENANFGLFFHIFIVGMWAWPLAVSLTVLSSVAFHRALQDLRYASLAGFLFALAFLAHPSSIYPILAILAANAVYAWRSIRRWMVATVVVALEFILATAPLILPFTHLSAYIPYRNILKMWLFPPRMLAKALLLDLMPTWYLIAAIPGLWLMPEKARYLLEASSILLLAFATPLIKALAARNILSTVIGAATLGKYTTFMRVYISIPAAIALEKLARRRYAKLAVAAAMLAPYLLWSDLGYPLVHERMLRTDLEYPLTKEILRLFNWMKRSIPPLSRVATQGLYGYRRTRGL